MAKNNNDDTKKNVQKTGLMTVAIVLISRGSEIISNDFISGASMILVGVSLLGLKYVLSSEWYK